MALAKQGIITRVSSIHPALFDIAFFFFCELVFCN
jgi:hypothetical protein